MLELSSVNIIVGVMMKAVPCCLLNIGPANYQIKIVGVMMKAIPCCLLNIASAKYQIKIVMS